VERVLTDFIAVLRRAGVRISISESLDAANAAQFMGYSNRRLFKEALSASLAKSPAEKKIFDSCFDSYFSFNFFQSPKKANALDPGAHAEIMKDPLSALVLKDDKGKLAALMTEAGRMANVTSIKYPMQKSLFTMKILNEMGMPGMEAMVAQIKGSTGSGFSQKTAEMLEKGRDELVQTVKEYVEQQLQLNAEGVDAKDRYLKTTPLSQIELRHFQRMDGLIQRLIKQLEDRNSRRLKTAKRGKLDYKKTLRKSISYGGFLFAPLWKKKKENRPDVVIICDISRSVVRTVRFLMLFIYGLNKHIGKIHTFIFYSNIFEASYMFDRYTVEESLSRIQNDMSLPIIRGRSDYSAMFSQFKDQHLHLVTKNTTVIILGDARNNYNPPRSEVLRAISERCKRLIWLNPETKPFWGTGDSEIKTYAPYCHLLTECNTLNHLERVIGALLSARR
jgi:uncharacterized protein with von Willebrand factor type A (vWA) domain